MKLRAGWEIVERGWYCNPSLVVSVHKMPKGIWESVATAYDNSYGGPFFKTLTAAMEDAELRAEK